MGLSKGKLPIPSNVTRISEAIKPLSSRGVQQVVFYQAGIGSTGNILNRVIGGYSLPALFPAEGLTDYGATLGLPQKACLPIYVTLIREFSFPTYAFSVSRLVCRRSKTLSGPLTQLTYDSNGDMLTRNYEDSSATTIAETTRSFCLASHAEPSLLGA